MAAAPKLKLTYFPFGGRAAPIRLALLAGKIDFEDHRLSFPEFGAAKAAGAFKFGQLPCLEVDGEQVAQSDAILRYVGRLGGFYPEDLLQAAKVDQFIDAASDVFSPIGMTIQSDNYGLGAVLPSDKDEQAKVMEAWRKQLNDKILPGHFANVEKALSSGGGEFLVGDSLTIADFKMYFILKGMTRGHLDHISTDILEAHPTVAAYVARLDKCEQVVAYNEYEKTAAGK